FAPETTCTNWLGLAAASMVAVWMRISLSRFNFRREWYKQGKTAKHLDVATPLFPIVPILGFLFCLITCISMVFDPSMRISFFGCLLFIALCYASYYKFDHKNA